MDNDPMVLAHARALLTNTTPEGVTTYIDADVHDPDLIVSDARNVLNFNEPIGVMFFGILGHVADFDEAKDIVAQVRAGAEHYARSGAIPYNLRSPQELAEFFTGLEMVEPGLVLVSKWRPSAVEVGELPHVDKYGAVARTR